MNIKSALKNALKGRITIAGVGNISRGDDGFGPVMAGRLRNKISACIIDGVAAPENHIKKIRESGPEIVLILDAADFGGKAGDMKLLRREDMSLYGLSTHNSSLALLFDFLKADTKAEVYMLAIQPARNDMNTGLSSVLNERCKELEELLLKLLPLT